MASTTPKSKDLTSSLTKLQISQSSKSKPKSAPVADSWEDEADLSPSSSTPSDSTTPTTPTNPDLDLAQAPSIDMPNAPPPTPASPTFEAAGKMPPSFDTHPAFSSTSPQSRSRGTSQSASRSGSGTSSPRLGQAGAEERRPDKSTATASRLIASALGVRPQKRSEEEREYERVVRAKERKRREEERSAKDREEREKEEKSRAVWED